MTEATPPAGAVDMMVYHQADDLPKARAFAQRHGTDLGMDPDQVTALVIAVSELITNTLQHTSGGGQVRIWADEGHVICDILDQGPMRTLGRQMPAADAYRGRGLAIVERLCDGVNAITSDEGTIVRLRFTIDPLTAAR